MKKNALRIALIGYGKMGKEIEKIITERGHIVSTIIDVGEEITAEKAAQSDVAIEFTRPDAAVANIKKCAEVGLPIVVGTTGWYESYKDVCDFVNQKEAALFTATNFSLGVNLFFQINKQFAKLMNSYPNYEVSMEEIHHTQKLDAPSGTAITTAENILSEYSQKSNWECPQSENYTAPNPQNLNIEALREDNVPGIHRVFWKSEIDCIEIAHTAYSRKGFATGAVVAAEWLASRKGIFTMNDLMGF